MAEQTGLVYSFLHAARGNWRNALYIGCRDCPQRREPLCGGFLLAMDTGGRPILMPAQLLRQVSGEAIDADECVATLEHGDFEALFGRFIEWTISSPGACPLLELSARQPGCE